MGIFEGITHAEEIEELLTDAQSKYDNAQNRMESQKREPQKAWNLLAKKR